MHTVLPCTHWVCVCAVCACMYIFSCLVLANWVLAVSKLLYVGMSVCTCSTCTCMLVAWSVCTNCFNAKPPYMLCWHWRVFTVTQITCAVCFHINVYACGIWFVCTNSTRAKTPVCLSAGIFQIHPLVVLLTAGPCRGCRK